MAALHASWLAPIYCAAGFATFIAAWGSLAGSHTAGTRRSPARASAPAARFEGRRAAGLTVRSDAPPSSPPRVGSDTTVLPWPAPGQGGPQLATTTGDPSLVVVALQLAGAS